MGGSKPFKSIKRMILITLQPETQFDPYFDLKDGTFILDNKFKHQQLYRKFCNFAN